MIAQEHGIEKVRAVYGNLFHGFNLALLPKAPLLSQFIGAISRPFRTFKVENPGEVDLDLAGFLINSPVAEGLLSRRDYDALICHSTLSPLLVPRHYARSRMRKVLHVSDVPIHLMMLREQVSSPRIVEAVKRFESWVVHKADAVVCVTKNAARAWHEIFGIAPEVIHPGCDPFPRFPYPKGNYLLSVTHWDPSRRPFFFLDLAERLETSKINIVMAGSWPIAGTYEGFQDAISKRGLSKKVLVVKSPDEPTLTKLLQEARCFVAPPVKGSLLMGALEAGAQGTPIVFPSESSAWEIFTPGVHGFEVDVSRPGSYLEGVERFEDDSIVEKMGYSIWKRSHECSWDAQGAKLEKVLGNR